MKVQRFTLRKGREGLIGAEKWKKCCIIPLMSSLGPSLAAVTSAVPSTRSSLRKDYYYYKVSYKGVTPSRRQYVTNFQLRNYFLGSVISPLCYLEFTSLNRIQISENIELASNAH